MPNRIVREGILTSERVAKLGWPAEVFYRRVLSVVDDFGRYYATPMLLRAACYPLQLDRVSDADIGKWMDECAKAALVSVYPASDGKRYLQVHDFRQQVRAKESKFPAPDLHMRSTCVADAKQPLADAHLDVDVDVDVDEAEKKPPRKRGSLKKSIPDDFDVSDRVKKWAVQKGYASLDAHLEAFRSKAKAKDYRYADWDEAFMGAIRDDWAKIRSSHSDAFGDGLSPAAMRRLA